MTKLRLGPIVEEKPVKLSIEFSGALMRELSDYARVHARANGLVEPLAPERLIGALESFILEETRPDLTLIFDFPPSTGLERALARPGAEARFESKGMEFHERLRAAFLAIARAEPERCALIHAEDSIEAVEAQVWEAVETRLAVHG